MRKVGISLAVVLCSGLVMAQGRGGRGGGQRAATPAAAPEEGFPVTDPLVIQKCGACHTKDEKGNLSRISWIRTARSCRST